MFDCGRTVLIMMLSPARGYMFNICKLHDYNYKPLLYTETPYYGKESLTVEGNPSLTYYINKPLI